MLTFGSHFHEGRIPRDLNIYCLEETEEAEYSQVKKTSNLPAGFTVCTASVVVAKDPPVVTTADPPVVASEEQDDAGSPLHAL